MNDDLHRKGGFLHEEAVDALRNKFVMMIGNAANTNQRHRAFRPMVFGNPARFRRRLAFQGNSLIFRKIAGMVYVVGWRQLSGAFSIAGHRLFGDEMDFVCSRDCGTHDIADEHDIRFRNGGARGQNHDL